MNYIGSSQLPGTILADNSENERTIIKLGRGYLPERFRKIFVKPNSFMKSGLDINLIYTCNCVPSLTIGKTNIYINLNIGRLRTQRNT